MQALQQIFLSQSHSLKCAVNQETWLTHTYTTSIEYYIIFLERGHDVALLVLPEVFVLAPLDLNVTSR